MTAFGMKPSWRMAAGVTLAMSLLASGVVSAAVVPSHRAKASTAVNLSGTWRIHDNNGSVNTFGTLTITQNGNTFTGSQVGQSGSPHASVVDGKISCDHFVTFREPYTDVPGFEVDYTGTIDSASSMHGTWAGNDGSAGTWDATHQSGPASDSSLHRQASSSSAPKCCPLTPSVTAVGHASRDGNTVKITAIARGLGSRAKCGRARLFVDGFNVGSAHRVRVFETTLAHGQEVAHASVGGRKSCITLLSAKVEQGGSTASADGTVADATPDIKVARAIRKNIGGAETLAIRVKAEDLRSRSACGVAGVRLTTDAGTVRFEKLKQTGGGRAGVARVRLKGKDACSTLVSLVPEQLSLVGRAVRQAVAGAPQPTSCKVP